MAFMKKKILSNLVTCSLCNHACAGLTTCTQIVGKGAQQVEVPMYHCRQCGGTYFTRDVALTLQDIRLHPEQCATNKSFVAATFLQAA
jgi:transcription elongation factor Elf1